MVTPSPTVSRRGPPGGDDRVAVGTRHELTDGPLASERFTSSGTPPSRWRTTRWNRTRPTRPQCRFRVIAAPPSKMPTALPVHRVPLWPPDRVRRSARIGRAGHPISTTSGRIRFGPTCEREPMTAIPRLPGSNAVRLCAVGADVLSPGSVPLVTTLPSGYSRDNRTESREGPFRGRHP